MKQFFIYTAMIGALLFCAGSFYPVQAAEPSTEIKSFTTMIDSVLDLVATQLSAQGSTLVRKGNISVEDAGGYYAATLPHIMVEGADGHGIDIGMIALNILPQTQAGGWRFSLALPTPMTWLDKDGAPSQKLSLQGQEFLGLWDTQTQNLKSVHARYRDVSIQNIVRGDDIFAKNISIIFEGRKSREPYLSAFLDIRLNGMKAKGYKGEAISLFPVEMILKADIKSLPFNALKNLSNLFLETKNNETARQIAMVQAMLSLPQTLSQANTKIDLQQFKIENELYKFQSTGNLSAEENSLFGVSGIVKTILLGGDNIKKSMGTASSTHPKEQKNIIRFVDFFERNGAVSHDKKMESTTHRIDFILGENGLFSIQKPGLKEDIQAAR